MRTCGTCDYLKRTSPEQVFLLCEFWSAERPPIPDVFTRFGYDYVITHCHMQPEAPACPFWVHEGTSRTEAKRRYLMEEQRRERLAH